MEHLNALDYTVIGIYFAFLIGLGLYLKKIASASLEDYFLGGRKLPWWALGIAGMASFLDITGTMVIVSFLFMLGPRGLFIAFRGGAVLVLVFMLLWTGKWHRRSGCMTGAEWMVYRFGEGFGGQFARIVGAIATIVGTIGMLAYMVVGVGLFLSMFLPFSPFTCSLMMIGVATAYTMVSGFYGVVFTDLFQAGIILAAVIGITVLATLKIAGHGDLAALAYEVTGSSGWTSSTPHWYTSMPKGYEAYRHLALIAMFYLMRNIFFGIGGTGADPKYFGARSDRECGTLTFLWTSLMMFRWPMMIGFAVLGLFLVKDMFPDQIVLAQAAELIKHHIGQIDQARWADALAAIKNYPQNYSQELILGLQNLLGEGWTTKLHLLSYHGTINPERILPAVILFNIPMGLRGMLLVALMAASMSTFDAIVNMTAGFFTRDIYQRYLRPKASTRELIYASWGFIIVIVAVGFLFGYTAKNINDIWDWIIMGLGGGLIVPTMLKFYWWRFNGGGYAIGTTVGICGAVAQRVLFPGLDPRLQLLIMIGFGLVGSIIGTYITRPTDPKIAEHFYRTTRPFGFWKPLRQMMEPDVRASMEREHRNDLIAVPFTFGWQITLFLMPMQLLVRSFNTFWITFAIFLTCLAGMYIFWYRQLPPASKTATAKQSGP